MTNQEWHSISRFESYDLARSWYQRTHQRQLNAAKTRQINAFFIQGREYFKSAFSSDMSVKPLLLYYGPLGEFRHRQSVDRSYSARRSLRSLDIRWSARGHSGNDVPGTRLAAIQAIFQPPGTRRNNMNLPKGLLKTARTAVGEPLALVRPLVGSVRAQFSMSRRNIQPELISTG